jgi:uroporphyrinogen decarboxylase
MGVGCHQEDAHLELKKTEDTAILSRGQRGWAPMDGVVKTRRDYEEFPWPDPDRPQTHRIEELSSVLPEGMGIIAVSVCVQEPVAERIMGVKALSRALYQDPDLVGDVCARLGEATVSATRAAAGMDDVVAVGVCDDFGYRSGTLLSHKHLREYVLPWHRKLVEGVHKEGKPAILHSCGNLQAVMDDIIDYCGYDVKHAFEDSHTPISVAKERWGDRISLCGGVDMDFLARRSEGEVRDYVRRQLRECGGKGYALGAGNSVANYIPLSNFRAMLDEGRRYLPDG